MVGEGEEHLQGVSSHLLQLLGTGVDHHPLGCWGIAGCGIVIQTLHRDDAQFAGAYWQQVRVVTKRRHIRARKAGCIENG